MKTFASYGKKGEERCNITMVYLNKQFTMCKQYPLSIKDFGDTGHYWEAHWCLQIDDNAKQYTKDLDKMMIAASDFWEGYKLGQKGGK